MANWNTDNVQSGFQVNESIDSMIDARSASREGIQGTKLKKFSTNKSTKPSMFASGLPSVVGINANQVSNVIAKIDSYLHNIESYVNDLDPTADAQKAFKSYEVIRSLSQYMDNVKSYVLNLVSNLKAFEDKLIDVSNTWKEYAGNLGTAISETAGDNFAIGSSYERTFQTPESTNFASGSLGGEVRDTYLGENDIQTPLGGTQSGNVDISAPHEGSSQQFNY